MQLARCAGLVFLVAATWAQVVNSASTNDGRKLLQHTQAVEPPTKSQQLIIVPAPVNPSNCMEFSDATLRATRGSVLCTSQYVAYNVTKVICNEWKPECQQTVTEYKLIDPAAPGAEQDAYSKTAVAACQLLGYQTFGTGTMHMIGAARETCWNGKTFSTDNWWTNLVCCKV